MKIAIVGTGYVGLVSGACFADVGHDVTCFDIDETKIKRLQASEVPFYEPGLEDLVARNQRAGRLHFWAGLDMDGIEVVFVCVGTPAYPSGAVDLTAVRAVVSEVAKRLKGYALLVIKSTVPPSVFPQLKELVKSATDAPFDLASNPEFLKEGAAIDDFTRPDRVVLGVDSEWAESVLRELYAPFVRTGAPIMVMDPASAALAKYASNAMLATRISFMNEMVRLCEIVGADIDQVRKVMAADTRIGAQFLFAGLGYGGSCFPKDVRALSWMMREDGREAVLTDAVHEINLRAREEFAERIIKHVPLKARVAVWGLSFKPKTDDTREAPALTIIERLLQHGLAVHTYDPVASKFFDGAVNFVDQYDALEDTSALVLCTEWNEFRSPDWGRVKGLLREPVLFDGRNIWDPVKLKALGFEYHGIGRGSRV